MYENVKEIAFVKQNLWACHLVDIINEVGVAVDIGNDAQLHHSFDKYLLEFFCFLFKWAQTDEEVWPDCRIGIEEVKQQGATCEKVSLPC